MSSSTCHHLLLSNPHRSFSIFISASKTPNLISLSTSLPHSSISSPNPNPILLRRRLITSAASSSSSSVSGDDDLPFTFDHLLSLAELLCLASSAAASIAYSFSSSLPAGWNASALGGGAATALVMAVAIGAWIRRRQWSRVSRADNVKGGAEVNLFERIEKMEEDLRSSATIVRVLSRQLEKLGIRFRVTRKALKEPIAETAALAQKNSEATRALAAQEDILEKELGETQKMLLAMQEQQQKQLDLILAIAKSGKLLDNKHSPDQPKSTSITRDTSIDNSKQKEPQQI